MLHVAGLLFCILAGCAAAPFQLSRCLLLSQLDHPPDLFPEDLGIPEKPQQLLLVPLFELRVQVILHTRVL
jgi:hypothetical protein